MKRFKVLKYVKRIKACQPGLARMVDGCITALLPWRCVVCSLESEGSGICRHCELALPWNIPACRACGMPLPGRDDPRCGACITRPAIFDAVVSPLVFGFPVNRLVHRFKFQSDPAAGRVLAELLAGHILQQGDVLPDLLIPVPMHRWRLLCRGTNPAYELARQLSSSLDRPLAIHRLVRTRYTPTQSGLSARRRRKNLKGAFGWRGAPLNGSVVALVDDVITTGSTVAECTAVLKKAGASSVIAWACARAIK